MSALSRSIEADDDLHPLIQLRVVYVNLDKDLGSTLSGKRRSLKLTLYRHAVPYRYKGKVKVHNILAGIRHVISVSSVDLPFQRLDSFSELDTFMESTDKTVILFDFCNWAQKLGQKKQLKVPEEHTLCQDADCLLNPRDKVENEFDIMSGSLCQPDSQRHEKKLGAASGIDLAKGEVAEGDSKVDECGEDVKDHECTSAKYRRTAALKDQQRLDDGICQAGINDIYGPVNVMEEDIPASIIAGGPHGAYSIESQLESEDEILHLSVDSEQSTVCSRGGTPGFGSHLSSSISMESNYAGNCSRNIMSSQSQVCNQTEYQRFTVLYRNLTKIARAQALTPERAKFGIIKEKALLSDLGLSRMQNFSWFLMVKVSERPLAPEFYFGDEEVDSVMSGSVQLVSELNAEVPNYHFPFSNDTPSVVLFIDRASPSLEVRRKSWEALRAMQVVAMRYFGLENSEEEHIASGDRNKKQKPLIEDGIDYTKANFQTQAKDSLFDLKNLLRLAKSDLDISNVKSSTTNLQVSESERSTGKKYISISGASKEDTEMILQILLGGDESMQIKPTRTESLSGNLLAPDVSKKMASRNSAVTEMEQVFTLENKGNVLGKANTESKNTKEAEDENSSGKNTEGRLSEINFSLHKLQGSVGIYMFTPTGNVGRNGKRIVEKLVVDTEEGFRNSDLESRITLDNVEMTNEMHIAAMRLLPGNDRLNPNSGQQDQILSFFFADGDDRLKDMIQHSLSYPSVVILDPFQGGQFVFPSNQSISQSSLKEFLESFANNSLQQTYHSEPTPQVSKKQLQPPFVNRDFHEVNGVPRVTINTFSKMVLGCQVKLDSKLQEALYICNEEMGLSWRKDVLVHFTAPWCGFCKRMELVFRELHRLVMKHLDDAVGDRTTGCTLKKVPVQDGKLLEDKDMFDTNDELPRLLQMDCRANDCSGLLNGIVQEESYPSIILFPGRRKESPILYDGGPSVREILNFLVAKGNPGAKILQEHGWTRESSAKHRVPMGCSFTAFPSQPIQIDSTAKDMRPVYHFTAEAIDEVAPASENPISQVAIDKHDSPKTMIYPTVGSVLLATEKLSKTSSVFENSIILIVKADGREGFQGLIINKPMSWKLLPGLDSEMEPIVNTTALCYGGPVIMHGQPFLSLTRLNNIERFLEVFPGVHFAGSAVTTRVFESIKDGNLKAVDFWFFLGHAVWSWQQLLDELAAHVWQLTTYKEGLIHLPVQDWLNGSSIGVSDFVARKRKD